MMYCGSPEKTEMKVPEKMNATVWKSAPWDDVCCLKIHLTKKSA